MAKQKQNRFAQFSPPERIILRVLLQNHANSVSEIALFGSTERIRVAEYLKIIEDLEHEIVSN